MTLTYPILILAAGRSERMGEPKGLVKTKNGIWLTDQVERLKDLGTREIIFVFAHYAADYIYEVKKYVLRLATWDSRVSGNTENKTKNCTEGIAESEKVQNVVRVGSCRISWWMNLSLVSHGSILSLSQAISNNTSEANLGFTPPCPRMAPDIGLLV